MTTFYDDLDDNMLDPEFAYEFGRQERELEIVKVLESLFDKAENAETRRLLTMAIALIKGENK